MNLLLTLIATFLIGSIAGFVAGFFGVGGGVIYVPGLLFYFKSITHGSDITQLATATSLGAIFITSSYGSYLHRKKGEADLKQVLYILIGGIPAAYIGAKIAVLIPGESLKRFFGILEIIVAILYVTILSQRREGNRNPKAVFLTITGVLAGFLSGLFGIGGGIIAVPAMNVLLRMPIKRSVGNSSNMIFFNSMAGIASYMLSSPSASLQGNMGYVNLPAAILLGLSSIFAVKISVSLFISSETKSLKIIYAFFLAIIGLKLTL